MKKILSTAAFLLLLCTTISAQDGKSIYERYSDAEGVSAAYISPAVFRLFGRVPDMNFGGEDVNLSSIIRNLDGLYLLDSDNSSVNESIARDVRKFLKSGKYEMMMEVKEDGRVVHIYTIGKKDMVTSLVILADEGDGCTFVCLDGQMSRKQLENVFGDIRD